MKKILFTFFFILCFTMTSNASDVRWGVSVGIGDPGFYGQINIGNYPAPALIYPQPWVVYPGYAYAPIYMRVPYGHAKRWNTYCHHYNACNHPVYFVQDRWYRNTYVPEYQKRHGGGHHQYHGSRGDGHHQYQPQHQKGPQPPRQDRSWDKGHGKGR